jgi:Zn-finger nucleic acid-binding protein
MTEQNSGEVQFTCPKCSSAMEKVSAEKCTVDRCSSCGGLWLDAGERLKLTSDPKLAELVDTGSTQTGSKHDLKTNINCPRCGDSMEHVQHPAQPHVGIEVCPVCKGSYLDAGELRDLSNFSILERLQAMLGL